LEWAEIQSPPQPDSQGSKLSNNSKKETALQQDPPMDASAIKNTSDRSSNSAQTFLISQAVPLTSLNGIQFYDPRRPQKYWVGPNEKYDTLNAALKALAVQYNTTVQWVENHIGNTNALSEIHENIRNSLQH
jgi:hypothetical protein